MIFDIDYSNSVMTWRTVFLIASKDLDPARDLGYRLSGIRAYILSRYLLR